MKDVKVLGSGCRRCTDAADLLQATADRLGVAIRLEKVTDLAEMARYGIASTPAVVVGGRLVHAGGLPKPEDVAAWLTG